MIDNIVRSKVLIVEDSSLQLQMEVDAISQIAHIQVVVAKDYQESRDLLTQFHNEILCAILDLHLPDALSGEIVDLVSGYGIPAIVFTSTNTEEVREDILSKGAIDYVLKDSASCMEYIVSLVDYIYKNQGVKALVVDDSKTIRQMLKHTLESHRFDVLEAADGLEALKLLNGDTKIKLVITDEFMPNMCGCEFTKEARKLYTQKELCIIGVSSHGNSFMTVDFLKNGANDFITKPFRIEEFVCRIMQSMTMLRLVGIESERNELLEKNHQKDIEFLKSARVASLGELAHNIGHHWRQPLSALALDVQYIRLAFHNNEIDAAFIEKYVESSMHIIQKMSKIIDEFGNIFNNKEQRALFDANECVNRVVELLSDITKKNQLA
jgi:PleD family two-component response regulator